MRMLVCCNHLLRSQGGDPLPEPFAEAGLPLSVALGRDVGHRALVLDQLSDAIGIVRFVRYHDGARAEVVEQLIGDLPVVCLPGGQAEPAREALRVDNDVDLGGEAAA